MDLKLIDGIPAGQVIEAVIAPVKYVLILAIWYYWPRVPKVAKLNEQGFNVNLFDEVLFV